MKYFGYILIHLLQVISAVSIYEWYELYYNHLGFMRNVSYYTQELAANRGLVWLIRGVILAILVLSLWLSNRKRHKESGLLLLTILGLVVWQVAFSLKTTPIYYLVQGSIFLIVVLQLLLVSLQSNKKAVSK